MGRRWRSEWVDGQVRATCGICGFPRRFPDELVLGSDNVFRCEKCNETPVMETDKLLATFRATPEEQPRPIGLQPHSEAPRSLLTLAAERVVQLFTGWAPTTTLNETFDTVPGGGGSSWSTGLYGGTITEASDGLARFDCPTGQTGAEAWVPTMTVPKPGTGRFYALFRFRFNSTAHATSTAILGASELVLGSPSATVEEAVGVQGAVSTAFFRAPLSYGPGLGITTASPIDAEWHYGELYWFDGYVRGSIDFGNAGAKPIDPSGYTSLVPYIGVFGPPSQFDVSGAVFYT